VSSVLRCGTVEIGTSTGTQLIHIEFSQAYPEFAARRCLSTIDAGLVRLDDLTQWTSNTSSLSTVCRLLNVQMVTDLARGVQGYWGRVGHYSIAARCDQIGESTCPESGSTAHLTGR
jgi:hypothetical protein